jgi:hypothetical protein
VEAISGTDVETLRQQFLVCFGSKPGLIFLPNPPSILTESLIATWAVALLLAW